MTAATSAAQRAAERAVRLSYGRLVAILAARTRDVAAAEDALADALAAALVAWPRDGVPERPEAWLVTAARRRMGHAARHDAVRAAAAPTLELLAETMSALDIGDIPDARLQLMFVCAHPAIDPAIQAPLMLQAVLGLDAAAIAASFLTSPTAMAQRLVRAKTKIRDAGIAFAIPGRDDVADRLEAVLAAVYACYGTGWEDALGSDPRRKGLADEAIWLGRLLVMLLPEAAEAKGLLALMLHCEARRSARRGPGGIFVPLLDQDPAAWDAALVDEAEALLTAAARGGRLGRFQVEACIQSVHAQRRATGTVDWPTLAAFHDLLVRLAPTLGTRVARAAVVAEAEGPATGLAALDELAAQATGYQPWWATRAHLLARLGRRTEAGAAFTTAAGLSEDVAIRAFLLRRAEQAADGDSAGRPL